MSKSFNFGVLGNNMDLDLGDMIANRKNPKGQEKEVIADKKPVKLSQKATKKKQDKDTLQALAFGGAKGKKKTQAASTGKTSSNNQNGKNLKQNEKNKSNGAQNNGVSKGPSDDWKHRDDHFVENQNEKELREVLLLSKLDYEANKEVYDRNKEEANKSKNKKKKKDKSSITLSLSEFNSCDNAQLNRRTSGDLDSKLKSDLVDENFFHDVEEMVRNALIKENRLKEYNEKIEKEKTDKTVVSSNKKKDSSSSDGSILVPITEVEKRDFEIQALRLEVESLKDILKKVKLRNKQLCMVLGTAEIREVAEVIEELKEMTKQRDDFSAEVASLSEQLEQEKTKVSQLQEKNRKK